MKTFRIPWRPLLITAGLLNGLGAVAQYVQVPATCIVVNVGDFPAAGVLGAGGRVTHNGVVVMPDPYDPGGTFAIGGLVADYWKVRGDLSFSTTNAPGNPVRGPISGPQSIIIESFNRTVRIPSESQAPSASTMARSKGRVLVRYGGTCPGFIEFDVLKDWSGYTPPIVGPNCFPSPAQLITYSVDQVSSDNGDDAIGFDQYYWTLKNNNGTGTDLFTLAGNTFYTSADRSSITINMLDPAFATWYNNGASGPYILQCCYGQANPWNGGTTLAGGTHDQCVTKAIGASPTAPTFTTLIPSCVNTNASSLSAAYTPVAGNTYSWTCTNPAWLLNTGSGTLSVSGMDANPGVLNLTVTGPCGTNVYPYPVNRNLVGISLVPQSTCVQANTGVNVDLPLNAQGNQITWGGVSWTGNNANATGSRRTFIVPANACAGAYTITATSTNCPTNQISVVINVKPATPVISGSTCVGSGGGAAVPYTSTAPCGATSYAWSNNMGMTGSSTTSTINLTPTGTANGSVYVTANGTNSCNSNQASLAVFRTPNTPLVTLPCVNTGMAGTATFAVTSPQASSTYTWSFPAAFGSPTVPVGSSVNINTIGTPGTYTCSVTASSGGSCTPVTTQFVMNVTYNYAGHDFT
ncbi:MAG TPA: hypothetical protein VHL57_09940, partial [Flavobacteriales bacterium]|nr:hypothetical protein [Flavobacteriales bacterium]